MLELNFFPFPEIKTPRLLLRKMKLNDAEELHRMRSDEEVMKYIDRPRTATLKDAKELLRKFIFDTENNNIVNWAIAWPETNKMIGTIGLWNFQKTNYRAEIGYMLAAEMQRKGLMIEALEAVINYAFNVIKLHSIEATINPGNEASTKILERNGFVKEAHFKENFYFNGKFLDSIVFSLLNKA